MRTGFRIAWLVILACFLGGCQTARYYHQAIRGEYEILKQREPITALLADSRTTPKLKQKFELVLQLRTFAAQELKLPIDKHYLTYVDLHRPYAVWNVHAAPELSLEPKKWWYPFVGRLKYRGYFAEADARAYGERLVSRGDDVYVEGVEAYSTLGWFSDPLLNTFISLPPADLAETIFHELAHQRLFLGGDTDFDEAFATAVAEEGVRRWFVSKPDAASYERYRTDLERNREFVALVLNTRRRLEDLYGPERRRGSARSVSDSSATWMRPEKARILSELLEDYTKLKASWGGYAGYDGWFGKSPNNAQLNTIALYYQLLPGFRKILAAEGGDLERFYKAVGELRKLTKDQRHDYLQKIGAPEVATTTTLG